MRFQSSRRCCSAGNFSRSHLLFRQIHFCDYGAGAPRQSRQHPAPVIDNHAVAVSLAAIGMKSRLRRRHDPALVFDGARPQQRFPVRAPGGRRERRWQIRTHPSLPRHLSKQLRKAHIVTNCQADPAQRCFATTAGLRRARYSAIHGGSRSCPARRHRTDGSCRSWATHGRRSGPYSNEAAATLLGSGRPDGHGAARQPERPSRAIAAKASWIGPWPCGSPTAILSASPSPMKAKFSGKAASTAPPRPPPAPARAPSADLPAHRRGKSSAGRRASWQAQWSHQIELVRSIQSLHLQTDRPADRASRFA